MDEPLRVALSCCHHGPLSRQPQGKRIFGLAIDWSDVWPTPRMGDGEIKKRHFVSIMMTRVLEAIFFIKMIIMNLGV